MPDITKEQIEKICNSLLKKNDEELELPFSGDYPEGYHDALLDILEAFSIPTNRARFQ